MHDSTAQTGAEALILDHRHLVPPIVREFKARLPSHVRADDLTSAGNLGLVQAARSYQPGRGSTFASWAKLRIRGAISDELRAMDHRLGPRRAKDRPALSLDVTVPLTSPGSPWADGEAQWQLVEPAEGPEDVVIARLEAAQVQRAVAQLPAHLQLVVHAAFHSDRTHREAAAEIDIPTGDFYLLRSEAIRAIRARLGITGPAGEHGIPLPRRLAHLAA